jgi:(p)ppGpp synthase/HD superfamily hydrolase
MKQCDSNIVGQALCVAIEAHAGQFRKADPTVPYIVHPMSVALTVAAYTDDDEVVCAAVLHDVLEDTSYGKAKLQKQFGRGVVAIVEEVSDKRPKDPWEKRRDAYLKTLMTASDAACLIACADKIDNVRSFIAAYKKYGKRMFTRFSPALIEYINFYVMVYEIVRRRVPRRLGIQLQKVLAAARDTMGPLAR